MDAHAEAEEVVGAFTAAIRLRLYALLTLWLGLTGIAAIAGGMIVGWLSVEQGLSALAAAAVLATATAGTLYDQSYRTRVSAAVLERGLASPDGVYESVPGNAQRMKTTSLIVAAIGAVLIAAILAFSFANAGTETDDDDRDDRTEQNAPDNDDD